MYYHGGPAGLAVGSYIEPPSKTRAPSLSEYGAAGIHRRDRVYCTTDPTQALIYACGHHSGRGAVYVVKPEDPIENDPDWLGDPGGSIQCPRAKIIAVRRVRGSMIRKVRRQVLGVYP